VKLEATEIAEQAKRVLLEPHDRITFALIATDAQETVYLPGRMAMRLPALPPRSALPVRHIGVRSEI
jgi:hypothetical protein